MLKIAMQEEIWGEVFNVGSGMPTKMIDMIKTIISVIGKGEYECVPWPESYAVVETGDYFADIQKIKRLFSWSPKTGIKEGLEETVKFLRKKLAGQTKP